MYFSFSEKVLLPTIHESHLLYRHGFVAVLFDSVKCCYFCVFLLNSIRIGIRQVEIFLRINYCLRRDVVYALCDVFYYNAVEAFFKNQ